MQDQVCRICESESGQNWWFYTGRKSGAEGGRRLSCLFFPFVIVLPPRPLLNESRFLRVFAGDRLVGRCLIFFFLHLPERRDILLNIFIFREKVSGTNNNWFPSFAALAQQFKKQTEPILVQ